MEIKSEDLLHSFAKYCYEHPEQRFWQALRNWCGYSFVLVSEDRVKTVDTFYWEGRKGSSNED